MIIQSINNIIIQLRREIELDLNCVMWITDEQRKLLDSLLNKRFEEVLKIYKVRVCPICGNSLHTRASSLDGEGLQEYCQNCEFEMDL